MFSNRVSPSRDGERAAQLKAPAPWGGPVRSLVRRAWAVLLVAFALSGTALAGVTPEASRVVFPANAVERSTQLFNVNHYPVLVQAWVDDGDITAVPQASKAPVVVLPPIFRMAPGDQTSLRLINAGASLPADRESLFWLNLYEIPATPDTASTDEQLVTVTMRTQVKVFMRPDKLPYAPDQMPKRLGFSLAQADGKLALTIDNPTPYYATIGALRIAVGGASQQATPEMLAPFSRETVWLDLPGGGSGAESAKLQFSVIGDSGEPVFDERTLRIERAAAA